MTVDVVGVDVWVVRASKVPTDIFENLLALSFKNRNIKEYVFEILFYCDILFENMSHLSSSRL